MKKPRSGHAEEFTQQVQVLEQRARSAGVGSAAPDVRQLRAVVEALGRIYRHLARSEVHVDLQRHIAALHRLISEVCGAHAPPAAPKRVPTSRRHRATTTNREPAHVDHRSPHQRFPEESGDSIHTLGGGLPGLGRRR
ncbi:MAG: hypothetical protein L0I76_07055 [Pseudonocardia sp.]|nr:hypothetical protein [Pseudonocardia sp.]